MERHFLILVTQYSQTTVVITVFANILSKPSGMVGGTDSPSAVSSLQLSNLLAMECVKAPAEHLSSIQGFMAVMWSWGVRVSVESLSYLLDIC